MYNIIIYIEIMRVPPIELINTSPHKFTFFFFLVRTQVLISQKISIIQYSMINCNHHIIHKLHRPYSSYKSKFVPFHHSLPMSPTMATLLYYFCEFWLFFPPDFSYKWYHAVFAFLWLVSLSMMPSRFTHVAAHDTISFFVTE